MMKYLPQNSVVFMGIGKYCRNTQGQSIVLCHWLGILFKIAFYAVPNSPLKHISENINAFVLEWFFMLYAHTHTHT